MVLPTRNAIRSAWRVLKNYYGVAPVIYTSERVWREELRNLPASDLIESPLWLAYYPFKKGLAHRDAIVNRIAPPVPSPLGRFHQLVDSPVSGRRYRSSRLCTRQCGHEPFLTP